MRYPALGGKVGKQSKIQTLAPGLTVAHPICLQVGPRYLQNNQHTVCAPYNDDISYFSTLLAHVIVREKP
jgi:hypothetical protein